VPPLKRTKLHREHGPRIAVLRKAQWQKGDGVAVRLRCPRGNGTEGCRGTLTIQFRRRPSSNLALGGSAPFEVASGAKRVVIVAASKVLQQALAERPKVKLSVVAATRDTEGAVRLTHARRFIAE
jgi:hypothetical protein